MTSLTEAHMPQRSGEEADAHAPLALVRFLGPRPSCGTMCLSVGVPFRPKYRVIVGQFGQL